MAYIAGYMVRWLFLVVTILSVSCVMASGIPWTWLRWIVIAFIAAVSFGLLQCYAPPRFTVWMKTGSLFDGGSGSAVPVGSGWSFLLNKHAPRGRVLHTRHMRGIDQNGMWGAGTRIKDVQAYLLARGQTMASYPSVENGTLGGWIASGSHGSGGTLWTPQFLRIRVRNLETNEERFCEPKEIFNDDLPFDEHKFLILDVQVRSVDNIWCKKSAFKIQSAVDATIFRTRPSHLRMLQIGRRGTMALLWTPLEAEDLDISHVDPHLFSQFGLWFQADILAILQSNRARSADWFDFPVEPAANYESRIRLADANRFTPEPLLLTTPIGLAFVNFEVFIINYEIDALTLWRLCEALSDMFTRRVGGRCELRCGKTRLFLDFVITSWSQPSDVFATLLKTLGQVSIRLHRGKAQVETFPFVKLQK